MKHHVRCKRFLLRSLLRATAPLFLLNLSHTEAQQKQHCSCNDGRVFEPGVVSYTGNSDREMVTRIEVNGENSGNTCAAIWIAMTEVQPKGTPYRFYLKRRSLRQRRLAGCDDAPDQFVKRSKVYQFAYHRDSISIREMPGPGPAETKDEPVDPHASSNANLWDSISVEDPEEKSERKEHARPAPPHNEFCRTAWVVARKDFTGHYVGIEKEIGGTERLVRLKGTQKVREGQLGQIEASTFGAAVVRFYRGSRTEPFATAGNRFLRWYDDIGGPYKEAKDDLYTSLRAYIVEVSLTDIIEVNDYMDQKKTDRT